MTQVHADMTDAAHTGDGGRHQDDAGRGAIDMIVHLAREGERDGLTLRDIRDHLDERGADPGRGERDGWEGIGAAVG